MSERQLEQREKHARLCILMDEKGYEAIILRKGANIAWLVGGRAHVPTTLELACMDLIVRRDGMEVVTNKIEAERLKDEELSSDEKVTVVNWFESRDGQLPSGERVAVDGLDPLRVNASAEIETLRRSLNPQEVLRLRDLARESALALGIAMRSVEKSDSEVIAAGKIAAKAKEGGTIPEGWAVDREGNAITDAKEALNGMLAPLGGAKGFALGLVVESMVAGLTSGALSTEIPDMFNEKDDAKGQMISHTIITIDADALSGETGRDRLNKLASSVTESGGRTPGKSRLHPLKIGDEGINLATPTVEELNGWAERFKIPTRL